MPPIRHALRLRLTPLGAISVTLLGVLLASHATAQSYSVDRVAAGLARPVAMAHAPGDFDRLFIVEQFTGEIRILDLTTGSLLPDPFLTVRDFVVSSEQGVLGLAFHPDYATNKLFYVSITTPETQVLQFEASSDPNIADAMSETPVISFFQPSPNHNGGWIGFGPDHMLYISSGDGGGSNDDGAGHTPNIGNAQDVVGNLLGKMLRIDVDGDDFPNDTSQNYAIPADNPFATTTGADEIWAYGLRNPWRASFDRATGDLYIADVGQGQCEEVNVQSVASLGGENYGWRLREGVIATPGVGGPAPPNAIDPIFDYSHGGSELCSDPGPDFTGISITGGYVYRGPLPAFQGRYFFADYITAQIWSLVWDQTPASGFDGSNYTSLVNHDDDPAFTPTSGSIGTVTTFGEDAMGNLYIADLDGEIFRLPEPAVLLAQTIGGLSVIGLQRRRRIRATR